MKKNLIILLIFISSIIINIFFWDYIEFPVASEVLANKFDNYQSLVNPLNDPLRLIIFLSIPFLLTLIFYQKNDRVFLQNLSLIFNYDKNSRFDTYKKKDNENILLFTIIFILTFEFLIIDFKSIVSNLDFTHEGMWLSASQNTKLTGKFWEGSYIIRGFFADFYPYFLWEIFSKDTIGLTRFFNLFIIFLNKILLVTILFKLSQFTKYSNYKFRLFFLLLCFIILSLQGYISPIFSLRSFLLLLFILTFLKFLQSQNNYFYIVLLGLFSSLGIFWFIDIGLYINFSLLIIIFYFLFKLDIKKTIVLVSSLTLGWLIFYLIFPKQEFFQFLNNSYTIFTTLSWFHGLEFPKPFVSLDARSGRALIMFLISGFLIIRSINSYQGKKAEFILAMVFLFIISLLYFNYGLNRSDSGHIRMATSFVYIPFLCLIFFFIFEKFNLWFEKKETLKVLSTITLIGIVVSTIFFEKKFEKKKITNFFNLKPSIEYLIDSSDNKYIDAEYFELINYYKNLTVNDECITIFTNEVALFYLIKKKSCSRYYFMWSSFPRNIQEKLVTDLKEKKPNFLIYFSEKDIFSNSKNEVKSVNNFILKNYFFYEKFNRWEIYKKKGE